jgi:RHS repeat-associated protein
LDYQRDEAGNVLLNTEILAVGRNYIYFNYDPANRIVKEAWRKGSGANVYGFNYSYDEAGNRLEKENILAGATTYWEYDLADQMTRQRSGTPVSVYFLYDANGNVSQEHDTAVGAGRTYYDYDPRNLLLRVGFPGAIPVNYFAYNGWAERIRKNDSTGGKKYTWDALQPVLERDLSNVTTQRLVKGYTPMAGIGEYLLQDVSGTVLYPLKNQVGTTLRQTDGSTAVKNYYEYDGWGQPFEANETISQQFRYTGKELDPDFLAFNSNNRRYHFPARTYFPFRATFSAIDPLSIDSFAPHIAMLIQTALNSRSSYISFFDFFKISNYQYVGGNPVRTLDPLGLFGGDPGPGPGRVTFKPKNMKGMLKHRHPIEDPKMDCCDLTLVEKPTDPANDHENNYLKIARGKYGGKPFSSVGELVSALDCGAGNRIKRIAIFAHGGSKSIGAGRGVRGDPEAGNQLTEDNAATWLAAFDGSKFCCGCEIYLEVCDTGNGKLPQMIADVSGCTVYAYQGGTCPTGRFPKIPWGNK